ncbi:MBL fold metallo-hydrolase [Leifsonia sp. NPDC058292]|uniref:MBL fold metallo-hydrolase n=1 Tax=Leifsonia sp. NPDC058292 TaxID=3346428 RepID=UPI0036DF6BE7
MSDVFAEVAPGVHRFADTCNVYVVTAPGADGSVRGIAIDFGSGDVLDHLSELGIDTLDAVLMTHHHRDQGQGLPRAVAAGIPIWVPPVEQDLFARVDEMWSARALYNDYNLRQDRFSLLEPVPIAGVVPEYRAARFGAVTVRTIPTPGHTMGSVTYLVERGDALLAFTGDLIYAPGKVWSLAATQWSYTENEGPAMATLSCHILSDENPSVLLPSHGEPMPDAVSALRLLAERMQGYVDSRRIDPWDLRERLERPFIRLTEHLLLNRTANSCSYVLLSDSGAALFIDYGYDMSTGWPAGTDRASRRPWLASLPALKRDFGVTSVEVVLGTHYHDDHIAGLNLLRDVEGTEVWLPEHVAPIMADPMRTDLPCQWFEPIPADRVLELGATVDWREYSITTHDLPGHTLYAAAFEFEVDGVRVLATGDQQTADGRLGVRREILNYQYRNRFRRDDFVQSAALYRRVAPGLMVTGHWSGREVDDDYLELLTLQGAELADIHRGLLPDGDLEPAADGNIALIEPFFQRTVPGATVEYTVVVANPYTEAKDVLVRLTLPDGWDAVPEARVPVAAGATERIPFAVTVGPCPGKRQRLAADIAFGTTRLGQLGDAVVDVLPRS